jgi:hypothetical protein
MDRQIDTCADTYIQLKNTHSDNRDKKTCSETAEQTEKHTDEQTDTHTYAHTTEERKTDI